MSYRVGVDLGTTFTAAAVANAQPPTMVGLGNRALQIPSVLFLAQDGEFTCGESAERRGQAEPDRVVREFKRRIGDSVPILVGGSPYSPQTLTARLLRHVWQTTTERMGSAPDHVVLTHPANWGPYKLELLEQIATLADIGRVVRCPEPVAAAAQYAAKNQVRVGDTIAAYDLGGGTFDACVLSKTADGFEVIGVPEGIEHLGGIDFDEALFRHAMGLLGNRLDVLRPDDPETTLGLNRLRRDCVEAKEALSLDVDAVLPVVLPGLSTTLRLTRSEFEGLIRPALEETVDALARTLRSAGVEASRLSAIVLIGGSSRIPLVGELLQERFGVPTALDTHPKHDVALGAVQVGTDALRGVRPARVVAQGTTAPAADAPTAAAPTAAAQDTAAQGTVAPDTATPGTVPDATPTPSTGPPDDPRAPTGPAGPSPGSPPAPDRRRRAIVVGSAFAVLVAGGVGVALANRSDTPSTPASSSRSSSSTSQVAPPPTTNALGLPISVPLTDDQLIVPAKVDGNWDLWLADIDQPAPVSRLTLDLAVDFQPVLAPDRRTVIYVQTDGQGNGRLLVKGATTPGDGRGLFNPVPPQCATSARRPTWNPVVADEIAVPCVDAKGQTGLYRFTTGGRLVGRVPLPKGMTRVDDPAYSPDGRILAFWAAPASKLDGGTLFTVAVDGGTPKVLVRSTTAGQDADPDWSPDGKLIVFRHRVVDGTAGGNADVYSVTTDGRGVLTRLTTDSGDEQNPVFSPDGSRIAYKSAAPDPRHPGSAAIRVWIMDRDGDNKRVLWSQGPDPEQQGPIWGVR